MIIPSYFEWFSLHWSLVQVWSWPPWQLSRRTYHLHPYPWCTWLEGLGLLFQSILWGMWSLGPKKWGWYEGTIPKNPMSSQDFSWFQSHDLYALEALSSTSELEHVYIKSEIQRKLSPWYQLLSMDIHGICLWKKAIQFSHGFQPCQVRQGMVDRCATTNDPHMLWRLGTSNGASLGCLGSMLSILLAFAVDVEDEDQTKLVKYVFFVGQCSYFVFINLFYAYMPRVSWSCLYQIIQLASTSYVVLLTHNI